VAQAFVGGEPCSQCGLSAGAANEIMAVQQARADDAVKAEFVSLRLRTDRAERDRDRLGSMLTSIREALRELDREDERIERDEWCAR
jgi:hypothetical protein